MDNRDVNVMCPFYSSGHKTPKNKYERAWKMRRIGCKADSYRQVVYFNTINLRIAYAKRYCKSKTNHENCPFYKAILKDRGED